MPPRQQQKKAIKSPKGATVKSPKGAQSLSPPVSLPTDSQTSPTHQPATQSAAAASDPSPAPTASASIATIPSNVPSTSASTASNNLLAPTPPESAPSNEAAPSSAAPLVSNQNLNGSTIVQTSVPSKTAGELSPLQHSSDLKMSHSDGFAVLSRALHSVSPTEKESLNSLFLAMASSKSDRILQMLIDSTNDPSPPQDDSIENSLSSTPSEPGGANSSVEIQASMLTTLQGMRTDMDAKFELHASEIQRAQQQLLQQFTELLNSNSSNLGARSSALPSSQSMPVSPSKPAHFVSSSSEQEDALSGYPAKVDEVLVLFAALNIKPTDFFEDVSLNNSVIKRWKQNAKKIPLNHAKFVNHKPLLHSVIYATCETSHHFVGSSLGRASQQHQPQPQFQQQPQPQSQFHQPQPQFQQQPQQQPQQQHRHHSRQHPRLQHQAPRQQQHIMPPNFTSQRHHQQHFPQQQMQYRDVTPVFCSAPSEQNHQHSQFSSSVGQPLPQQYPGYPSDEGAPHHLQSQVSVDNGHG